MKVEPLVLRRGLCYARSSFCVCLWQGNLQWRTEDSQTSIVRPRVERAAEIIQLSIPCLGRKWGLLSKATTTYLSMQRWSRTWCPSLEALKVWADGPLTEDAGAFSKIHFLIDFSTGQVILSLLHTSFYRYAGRKSLIWIPCVTLMKMFIFLLIKFWAMKYDTISHQIIFT